MSPASSARGMKSLGEMGPCMGCDHLASASMPESLRLDESTMGWYITLISRSSTLSLESEAIFQRRRMAGMSETSSSGTSPLVERFASLRASSAQRKRSSPFSIPLAKTMPIFARQQRVCSPIWNGFLNSFVKNPPLSLRLLHCQRPSRQ